VRLKQLKLAGFKSFVDPTSFDVPSQLVGVVGPNGCGKSNVMDAVRWVLGESRASELRGESMQDVIFNGSSERKPAARASVELIFDNSLGRIGGSWGQYAEISVKRTLSRDGQSAYLINNQIVRRKDVHDLFMGTGLGPRAYAIIGQGMISRIIEAKPEELRVFLEEAAGVSKYKERRKETENRLSDTRENLSRVEDILRELGGQIDKLERQAEVAERFKDLDAQRERTQRMLWVVRRDEARQEEGKIAQEAASLGVQLESVIALMRSVQASEEQLRTQSFESSDRLQQAQQGFYERNAAVASLEAEIRFAQESRAQLIARRDALDAQAASLQQQLGQLDEAEMGLAQQTESGEMAHAAAQQAFEAAQGALPAAQQELVQAREVFDQARASSQQINQALQVSSAKREAAQRQLTVIEERASRIAAQREQLAPVDQSRALELELELSQAAEAEALLEMRLEELGQQSSEQQDRIGPVLLAAQQAQEQLADSSARLSALQALQAQLDAQDKTQPWLAEHGLERLGSVADKLVVQEGWALAVEAVLRDAVFAKRVERLEPVAQLLTQSAPGRVAFVAPAGLAGTAGAIAQPSGIGESKALADLVSSSDPAIAAALQHWTHQVWVAPDLTQALALREQLPVGGRVVTRQGHLVDCTSIRAYGSDGERDGVLQRRAQIENLDKQSRAQRLLSEQARAAAVQVQALAAQLQDQLRAMREEHARALRDLGVKRLAHETFSQQQRAALALRQRIEQDEAELAAAQAQAQETIDHELNAFDELDAQLAIQQEQAEVAREGLDAAQERANRAADQLRQAERELGEAQFREREAQSAAERLRTDRARTQEALERVDGELTSLAPGLEQIADSGLKERLQEALEAQRQAEGTLALARQAMEQAHEELKQVMEQRALHERAQEPLRLALQQLQLKEQAARLAAEQFVLQLNETSFDEVALLAHFAEARPRAANLQAELSRLTNSIASLGAVNLAALEELQQVRERQEFLASQSKDLNDAIGTLEDAIRRIDRETRELLQTTYNTVNEHFGRLFPELFGGGDAKLVLTGDEILDSGIQVMAHPPGKRNASIHLLSGGEKALTAIALVFALFQLNPAPFCLLDEVDAPLDDANTERYCDMVRRMSDQTQFLFITHNKIAMELAQQLIGVTMQERGVSRIVAVDLELAAGFAQAA
jgi:chromosome segregation protein